MATQYSFRLRRDTPPNWLLKNPILEAGEQGLELGTGKFKIGDGARHWDQLDYFIPDSPEMSEGWSDALQNHIGSETPHPVYDDGPSLDLLYQNAKV